MISYNLFTITTVFSFLQIGIIVSQFGYYSLHFRHQNIRQFIALTLLFVAYNMLYNIPDSIYTIIQVKMLLGLTLFVSSFWYLFTVIRDNDFLNNEKSNVRRFFAVVFLVNCVWFAFSRLYEPMVNCFQGILPTMFVVMVVILYLFSQRRLIKKCNLSQKIMLYVAVSIALSYGISFSYFFQKYNLLHVIGVNLFFGPCAYLYFKNQALYLKKTNPTLFKNPQRLEKLAKYGLSERQLEIANLMLEGYSFPEIGEKLNIAPKTATKHGSDIYNLTKVEGDGKIKIKAFRKKFS